LALLAPKHGPDISKTDGLWLDWNISKWVRGSISVISNPVPHLTTRMISELMRGSTPRDWMHRILYVSFETNSSFHPSRT
jgi:hypothetical protein